MRSLPDLVNRRWRHLVGPGVVAVSGGADSVALLRYLADRAAPLVVAHLNHRLRGSDSDDDERFVRELAEFLRIDFRCVAIDVRDLAARGTANLEDTARRTRYDWLVTVANDAGASWVATGHTADDQAETVLHRLIRGAGIQGLRGIAPERELAPGITLLRPMLEVSRSEVVAYLNSLGQPWREDISNLDPAYTRNRIRHELLPLLKTFNPAMTEVLGRLAEQAGEIHSEQEDAASQLLREAELPRAGTLCVFRLDNLRTASRHRVRGMFRQLWAREHWPLRDMTFEHWKRLVAVSLGEENAADLPGGVSIRRKGSVLQVGR